MKSFKFTLAALECLLIVPAVLFMTALFTRQIQPTQFEPAHTASRLVDWYAARPVLALDIFLITLPFVALVIGAVTVLKSWRRDPNFRQAVQEIVAAIRRHISPLLIAGATVTAAAILAIVALHIITD